MATAENMQGIVLKDDAAPNGLAPIPSDPNELLSFVANAVQIMHGTEYRNSLMSGISTTAELATVMLYGARLGLHPFSAAQEIHVIKGHMSISAEAMRSLLLQNGIRYEITDHSDEHCEITLTRGDTSYTHIYSLEDARRAQLLTTDTKPDSNWIKRPQNMLRARALTEAVRWFCPDILHGALEVTEAQEIAEPRPAYQPRVVEPEPEPAAAAAEEQDYIDAEVEPEDEPVDPDEKARQDLVDALQRNGYVEATHKQWIECALEIDTPLEELTAAQCIAAWKRIKEIRQQGTATAAEEEPQPVATPAPQAGDFTSKNPLENVAPIYTLWQYAGLTTAQIRSILADWGGEISADDISAAELLSCWEITWNHLTYAQDGKLTWQEVA